MTAIVGSWPVIGDTLKTIFEATTGVKASWAGSQKAFRCNPQGIISITTINGLGIDEIRYEFIPATDKLLPFGAGQRYFTFQAQVETDNPDPRCAGLQYLEQLRSSLRLPGVRSRMKCAEISVRTIGTTTQIQADLDDRFVSRATLEVSFNAAVSLVDCPIDFINQAEVEQTLDHPGGNVATVETYLFNVEP